MFAEEPCFAEEKAREGSGLATNQLCIQNNSFFFVFFTVLMASSMKKQQRKVLMFHNILQ